MRMTTKIHSPYEGMLKKFSEAHKVKCRTVEVGGPKEKRPEKEFMTGSKYKGTWDVLGMCGSSAVYTFPNGVIYEVDFEDGLRHGDGEMRYPTGEIIKGRFRRGQMVERTLIFADGLEYTDNDWMYCKIPDRRFTREYEEGIMPAGRSFMTADFPTREIPPGYYDTGDGFFDSNTKVVYKPDDLTAIQRSPNDAEHRWILENCRKTPNDPLGPRPDLYEDWLEPESELEKPPLPAAISTATAWMFESKKSMTSCYSDDSDMVSICDFTKWFSRLRQSSFEKIPSFEKRKSHTPQCQSRLQVVENFVTPDNQPLIPSVEKSTISENPVRPQISRSSVVGKSTTPTNPDTPRKPRFSVVGKSTTPTNPDRPRILRSSVFGKSTTPKNPVTPRISRLRTVEKFRPSFK